MLFYKQNLTTKITLLKISVIIFTELPGDSRFIGFALSPGEENKNLAITEKNFSQITSVNLNNYDVVVLIGCNFSGYSDRLNSYLSNGGSIFLMPGSLTNLNDFKSAASKLQLPLPVSDVGKTGSTRSITAFDKTDFDHPIFANIFEKNAKKQIESPDIYRYFKTFTQGKGKNIISLADNSPFLSEYKIRKGKVLLMTSAPLLGWNNLPLKGIFAPMIYKSVFYLASKNQQIFSYVAGETVNINLQNNTLPQVKILKPDKSEEYINLNNQSNQVYIPYSKTDVAGNYKIYSGQKLIDYFSVNPNPLESDITKLTQDEINGYLKQINFKGKTLNLEPDENYSVKIQQARFGSELWRIFLIIAFILALIEMMVARSTKKELV